MYTNVSNDFKEAVKSRNVTAVAKMVFSSPDNITIYGHATEELNSSLQEVTITDNCYYEGKLLGTAMAKEVEIRIVNKDNLNLADKEFELFVGVKFSNGEYEYIPYGKYIITTYEDTKSNNIYKIIAYDYMTKLNEQFEMFLPTKDLVIRTWKKYYEKVVINSRYEYQEVADPIEEDLPKYYEVNFNPTLPITLKEFKRQLLNVYNIECENQILPNDSFMVRVMPNFDGMTVRNVIGRIAELQGCFAKINRENQMQFYPIKNNNILPAEYQEVEYVEATGTQYIELDYKPKTTTKIDLDIEFFSNRYTTSNDSTISQTILCSRDETSINKNNFQVNFGAGSAGSKRLYFWVDNAYEQDGQIHYQDYQNITNNRDHLVVQSGEASFQGNNTTIAVKTANQISNLFLLYQVGSSGNPIMRRYDTKIYSVRIDEGQNLIVNLIPCYRKSDGISGLYDTINKKFYTSKTEENFDVGQIVISGEKIDSMSMNSSLEIDKQYGVVNCVSLALANVEGENVTRKDVQSIQQYGETMITITDNPFVYTELLRELAINELFESLNGFYYIPTKFKYKARLYTDGGDRISVENVQNGEYVNSIILNQYIKIPATRQSELSNLALSDTAIKNQYISQSKQANTHTEISVDKQKQTIDALVSSNTDLVQKTTKLTLDIQRIEGEIGTIVDVTTTVEGYDRIEAYNLNQGEPILLKIHPTINWQWLEPLYPSKNLYPSPNLFPHSREIVFKRINENEDEEHYEVTYNLPCNLYVLDQIHDEFVLDYENQQCYVIHRLEKFRITVDEHTDWAVIPLGEEYTEYFDFPTIPLEDGDYQISIPTANGVYIYARLMVKNIYTSQFATKVDLKTSITLTNDSIQLLASEKLDKEEVISAINQSPEQIQIQANKISLEGKEINLTSDNIVINSTNFQVDKNGNMRCNNAQITGDLFHYYQNQLAVAIQNYEVGFYDWQYYGIRLGGVGATVVSGGSKRGITFDVGYGNFLSFSTQSPNDNLYHSAIQFDERVLNGSTPFIRNTASGTLFPEAGGITVENGLIKTWNLATASGVLKFRDLNGVNTVNVTVKNGLIINWTVT